MGLIKTETPGCSSYQLPLSHAHQNRVEPGLVGSCEWSKCVALLSPDLHVYEEAGCLHKRCTLLCLLADDPSKTIAWLRKLIPVFLFLSISREFNSLIFPSTLAAFLPILFLTLGSVVFLLEIFLLHRWLFKTLRS